MALYRVELLGLSHMFPGVRDVEIEADPDITLGELVKALRRAMPTLEGRIIKFDEDELAGLYAFNVNGRFYLDEYGVIVQPADHILLIMLAFGG